MLARNKITHGNIYLCFYTKDNRVGSDLEVHMCVSVYVDGHGNILQPNVML